MKKILFILFFGISPAYAESINRVVDGDTVILNDANPPKEFLQNQGRLIGIDTPESRKAKCAKEKQLGLEAKKFTENFLAKKGAIVVNYFPNAETKKGWDSFGRYLITIKKNGKDLADELVRAGLAVYYDGITKTKDWCK